MNHPNRERKPTDGDRQLVRITFEFFSPHRGRWTWGSKWRPRGPDADELLAEMRARPKLFRNIHAYGEISPDETTIADLRGVPTANLIAEVKIRGYRIYGQRLAALATEPAQSMKELATTVADSCVTAAWDDPEEGDF